MASTSGDIMTFPTHVLTKRLFSTISSFTKTHCLAAVAHCEDILTRNMPERLDHSGDARTKDG